VSYGASAIELYQDLAGNGFPVVPKAQLIRWANLTEFSQSDAVSVNSW
jgi:hypothetical protein